MAHQYNRPSSFNEPDLLLKDNTTFQKHIYSQAKDDKLQWKTFSDTDDCIIQHCSRIYSEQMDINGAAITSGSSGRADRDCGFISIFATINIYSFWACRKKKKTE